MKKICVLFSIITIATASMNTETDNLLSTALRFVRDCGDKSMLLCAKVSKVFFLLSSLQRTMQFFFNENQRSTQFFI